MYHRLYATDRLRLLVASPSSSGNVSGTSEPKLRLALPLCLRSDAVGRVLVITDGVRCLLTYSYVMSCHPSFPSLKINKLFSTGPAPKKLLVLVFRGWDRVSIPFLPGFP